MLRSILVLPVVALWAATANAVPFHYHEGFETADPTVAWATDGKCQVAFKGISTEAAHDGTHSLKLDVTLKSGTHHYWAVPLHVPVGGKLSFTGWIKVVKPTNAAVGLGPDYVFPPTRESGCGPFQTYREPTDGWQEIKGDLVGRGKDAAHAVIRRHVAGGSSQNVVVTLDRWGIFVTGAPGTRVLCYIDDITIDGDVPSADAQAVDAKRRFAPVLKEHQQDLKQWLAAVKKAEAVMAHLTKLPAYGRELKAAALDDARQAKARIASATQQGYFSPQTAAEIKQRLPVLKFAVSQLKGIIKGGKSQTYLTFITPAITNERILPNTFVIPGQLGKSLSVSVAPGEYESASFTIYTLQAVKNLRLAASSLHGKAEALPATVIDPYIVKCWFQGAGGIGHSERRVLKPELLLKDSNLIHVDLAKQVNTMRQTDAHGYTRYVNISRDHNDGAQEAELKTLRPRDADTLQPITLRARTAQQFWLKIRIPANAKPGAYVGTITLTADGLAPTRLALHVHVLPFHLAQSPLIYSIYYRGRLTADGRPIIGSERKSSEQMLAELRDMKAHGVEYPTCYQGFNKTLLAEVVALRAKAGLPKGPFFSLGVRTGSATALNALVAKQDEVRQWERFLRPYGYTALYVYGADEARGKRLIAQTAAWRAVQEAGAKTFVAGYKGTFKAMGPLLNLLVYAGYPDPAAAKRAHALESRILSYADPQVGVEEPQTYRRNYGLLLWKNGFDGAMDYAYQHAFGNIWDDFDDPRYRDHVFAYPTVNRVIDTTEWEGFHEGVEDVRYLETLIQLARKAKSPLAERTGTWIKEIDPKADLDALRAEIIARIEALMASR